jgi:hypothetical protein
MLLIPPAPAVFDQGVIEVVATWPRCSNLCRLRRPLLGLAPVAWLVRERDIDPFGIEHILDPTIHLPTNPPLFVGLSLDATLDHHGRVPKMVHAQHLERL